LDQGTTVHQLASRLSLKCHRNLLHFYSSVRVIDYPMLKFCGVSVHCLGQIISDYERSISHMLSEGMYAQAITALEDAPFERGENIMVLGLFCV
jgi:hypothetical protein